MKGLIPCLGVACAYRKDSYLTQAPTLDWAKARAVFYMWVSAAFTQRPMVNVLLFSM